MKNPLRSGLLALGLVSCTGCDQAVKAIARGALESSPPVTLLGGAVRLEYTENPGAFLSLGANLPATARFLVGVVFVAVSLATLLVFTFRAAGLTPRQKAGLTLILGGGLGNLIDRLANHGQVIDFVSLGVGPLHTGIFNVADVAITAGVLLMFLSCFKQNGPGPESEPSA
ncbi:MAG TPA: signal peptidase II [Thermoanaerobaculia bacterium]|jgi:signal peptidase II|nr:signal peptidase II [Thermoanaerobaculia bacterium]